MANEQLSSNDKGISKEDIIDELNKDDKSSKDKDDASDEDQDEETDQDESDEEEESDESGEEDVDGEEEDKDEIKLVDGDKEDDEDKELKDIKVGPFRRAQLEKDFPGVLKKYPYLEQSYYRDRAFTEVFATPDDAKEAQSQLETLNQIESNLLSGSSSEILNQVKEHDPKAFLKLVDNYLPSLNKVDPAAHDHIVGGVVKNLITMLAEEAQATENDELRKVALAINKFVFRKEDFVPHKPLAAKTDESDKVADERRAFMEERAGTVQEDLQTRVDDIISATIKSNIDPRGLLSDYVKKNAVRDAMESLREALDSDTGFRKNLDKLWVRAYDNNFNRDSVNAIRAAYLGKAKVALLPAIKKARNEALKGIGKRVRDDGDSDTQKTEQDKPAYHRGAKARGSSSSSNRGQKSSDVPKGMSTLDYLNKD